MRRRGDARKPVWITELGWASDGPPSEFTVGGAGQATHVEDALRALAGARARLGLRGVIYFGWRDGLPYEGGRDFWGLHTGLLDLRGRPKPALASFEAAVRGLSAFGRSAGSCACSGDSASGLALGLRTSKLGLPLSTNQ